MSVTADYLSISCFKVKVDGQEIAEDVQSQLLEVVVDSNLHLPDMALVKFYDTALTLLSGTVFDIGKALEIAVSDTTLFKGEVTAIEPEFAQDGYALYVVRGYDKSHRLHRGRKTKVYANQTDSEIASSVAGGAGLTVSVDSTSAVHEHIWQNNQTDMEFLHALADANGYHLYMQDGTLYFKKDPAGGSPVELEWKTNLRSFHPRLAASVPADKVTVKAYDVAKKTAVTGVKTSASSTANQGGVSKDGGAAAKTAFGAAEVLVAGDRGLTSSVAGNLAQAVYDEMHGEYVQAEGTCVGLPSIKAGTIIKTVGVGTKFSGNYRVTSATHIFTAKSGYETSFSIHGRRPDTLADLLAPPGLPGERPEHLASINGVVPAVVTNVTDPDGLGRVKVKYPWLSDDCESALAYVASPGAGPTRGIYFIPEVNDLVLVAFEHGDINRPYVLGGIWNKTDNPPKKSDQIVADGKVNERIIQSRSGHVVILSDKSGEEKITIRDKTGKNEFVIDSVNNSLSIKIEDGITIEAKGAITIKTTNGDMTLQSKNLNIKAQQNFKVEATGSCNIKSTQMCTVEGTAGVTVKNAVAKVALSGPSVNINNGALEVT